MNHVNEAYLQPGQAVVLTEVTRGDLVESRHYGHVAVVNPAGHLLAWAGDPAIFTYMRSAAKPVQALPLVESGGADRFGLSDAELALCCASHSGEPRHRETVLAMLARAGLKEEQLWCGPHRPQHTASAAALVREGREPTPVYSNCSGKHTGMLLSCLQHGWDLDNYYDPAHPLQQRIHTAMAEMTDLSPTDIATGIDGCGVPAYALPLRNMALVFARLADPSGLAEPRRSALGRLSRAMSAHPEMVAGEGRFTTELMRIAPDRLAAKSGAEGSVGIGVRPGFAKALPGAPAVGIMVKTEDGNFRSTHAAAVAALEQLGVLTAVQHDALQPWQRPTLTSLRGVPCGEIRPAFRLSWVADPLK